jgi:hypothetical protein
MKPWIEYCDSVNWHEAANIFPLMPDDEMQKLADDIKTNGQKNTVILLNDKVLDGRNRLLACKLAGVRPNIESRNPDKLGSPVAWVLSQNLHRRQLTTTQRAFVAVEAEKQFAIEAKQRQLAAQNNAAGRAVKAILPEQVPEKRQARDQAAKALAVSPRYVTDAKAIAAKAPEVAAQAVAGKFTMAEAKKLEQLKPVNPKLYQDLITGKVKLRDTKIPPKTAPKRDMRKRYSEKDYFARIGRMLAATLAKHPPLDELLAIQKADWTPEAEYGFKCLIKNLDEVSERAHDYANGLNKVLRTYGKAKAV